MRRYKCSHWYDPLSWDDVRYWESRTQGWCYSDEIQYLLFNRRLIFIPVTR